MGDSEAVAMLKAVACGLVKLPAIVRTHPNVTETIYTHTPEREEMIDLCQKGALELGWLLRHSVVHGGEMGWLIYDHPPPWTPMAVGSFEQCCRRIVEFTLKVNADDAR